MICQGPALDMGFVKRDRIPMATIPVPHNFRGTWLSGVGMPNMTVTADEETLRWARMKTAELDTSVARLLGDILKQQMEMERGYAGAMHRFLGVKARVISQGRLRQELLLAGELADRLQKGRGLLLQVRGVLAKAAGEVGVLDSGHVDAHVRQGALHGR